MIHIIAFPFLGHAVSTICTILLGTGKLNSKVFTKKMDSSIKYEKICSLVPDPASD